MPDELLGLTELVGAMRRILDEHTPHVVQVTADVPLSLRETLTVAVTAAELTITTTGGGSLVIPVRPS